jgi:hypothetical protein
MEIIFTEHAEERLEKRKFLRTEIIEAIKFPDKILKKHEKYYHQKTLERGKVEIVCETREKMNFFCTPKIFDFLARQKNI